MPLYEYKCSSCGKKFEVIQKFSDEPLQTHPECGGPVEKLFSAPAFHLKGTGWYATDYAKNNGVSNPKPEDGKPANGAEKPDAAPAAATAEGKSSESKTTESKPAVTETKPAATTSDPK
jgi:putative FmdB family regulatory protein